MAASAAAAAARAVAAACGEPSLVSSASSRPVQLRGVCRPLLEGELPPQLRSPGHSARRVAAARSAAAPGAVKAVGLRPPPASAAALGGELSCAASRRVSSSLLKSITKVELHQQDTAAAATPNRTASSAWLHSWGSRQQCTRLRAMHKQS